MQDLLSSNSLIARTTPLEPPFPWTCPFCDRPTTVNHRDIDIASHELRYEPSPKGGNKRLVSYFVFCPNPECKEVTLLVEMFPIERKKASGSWSLSDGPERQWQLIPPHAGKQFPNYIPKQILNDYAEACQVQEASPKAAATLARRCLQGMIRDFWGIRENRLVDEINALASMVDPLTWNAIDAVRKIGNIGAHMENDVNLIIDVEPQEAGLLITLIENLLGDWYVNRHERDLRFKTVVDIASKKRQ